jgi:hypothetical protein
MAADLPEDVASRLDALDMALDALEASFEPFTSAPLQQVLLIPGLFDGSLRTFPIVKCAGVCTSDTS